MTAKAMLSWYSVAMSWAPNVSPTPMTSPPSTAPGMLPSEPTTAAAMPAAIVNDTDAARPASMPMVLAVSRSSATAPRCLFKDAFDNLELGVMHAGVARDKVFPIDQDLAYKELDKLKGNVGVWWSTGALSVQAIVNKDCVMGTAWNGRPFQLITRDKAPLGVAWGDAILRTSWWAIPKGAKHVANAMKLLAWMQDPGRQAAQASLSGYAGGNKGTAALLPPTVAPFLTTSPEHLATTLVVDDSWWSANGPAAEKRFTGWVVR